MTKRSIVLLVYLSSLPALSAISSDVEDCKARLKRHQPAVLGMSFRDFDQGEEGWRSLALQGCFKEAAQLIDTYLSTYPHSPVTLRWNLAQTYGRAGNYREAKAAALTTIRPEPGQYPTGYHWNDYVLGHVAFWDLDLVSLSHHLNLINAETAADPLTKSANETNARVLAKLLKCFGKAYDAALNCPKQ